VQAHRLAILEALGVEAYVPRSKTQTADAHAGTPAAASVWDVLAEEVRNCRLCGLCETRTQTVFGVGDRKARLMVIGEAPGAEEDRQGEPFVGRAGILLNAMLRAAGFERGEVYIANLLKCRPPQNRDPTDEEAGRCLPYLRRQIELVAPEAILCVGRIAAQRLLETDTPIGKLRGRVHELDGRPVVVTYHPAYLLRSPGEKRKSWDDLKLALGVLATGGAVGDRA
jgi:uracil-DNA glycosylase family 4